MTQKTGPLEIPRRIAPPVREPNIKRNTETLAEHRARLKASGIRPLTLDEEALLFPGDRGYA